MMNCNKPWVEKYRPQELNDVVLDALNKSVLQSILDNNHFPNLLLHGPPGTGKTTTVVSLIKAYQQRYNQQNKGLMIHLNASDERGIDIIRNQIHQFVNAKSMYCEGLKFVILDEVDYMTKNAQQALKYLLQACVGNVRFCLICNYISRIDDSLQNEFVRMRFNQLPSKDIISFLQRICDKENMVIDPDNFIALQSLYRSDIRSMINYMQSNQHNMSFERKHIFDSGVWLKLTSCLQEEAKLTSTNTVEQCVNLCHAISLNYNLDIKSILIDYLHYLIQREYADDDKLTRLLTLSETIIHSNVNTVDTFLYYSMYTLYSFFRNELD